MSYCSLKSTHAIQTAILGHITAAMAFGDTLQQLLYLFLGPKVTVYSVSYQIQKVQGFWAQI
jgi:hypothetical protein